MSDLSEAVKILESLYNAPIPEGQGPELLYTDLGFMRHYFPADERLSAFEGKDDRAWIIVTRDEIVLECEFQ